MLSASPRSTGNTTRRSIRRHRRVRCRSLRWSRPDGRRHAARSVFRRPGDPPWRRRSRHPSTVDRMPSADPKRSSSSSTRSSNAMFAPGSATKFCGCHHRWRMRPRRAASRIPATIRWYWRDSSERVRGERGRRNVLAGTLHRPEGLDDLVPPERMQSGSGVGRGQAGRPHAQAGVFATAGAIGPARLWSPDAFEARIQDGRCVVVSPLVARQDQRFELKTAGRSRLLGRSQVGPEGRPPGPRSRQ